jgi:hypothetical protein
MRKLCSYSSKIALDNIMNCSKYMRTKELEVWKEDRSIEKKEKNVFCKLERVCFLLFFHCSFSFTRQGWFAMFEIMFWCLVIDRLLIMDQSTLLPLYHSILNHSKWSTYDEEKNKCSIISRWLMRGCSTLLTEVITLRKTGLVRGNCANSNVVDACIQNGEQKNWKLILFLLVKWDPR